MGAVTWVWALGEPEPRPMLLPGASQAVLPPVDEHCMDQVLVADSALTDPAFVDAAVLICHHQRDGALGFILNRPAAVLARHVVGFGPLSWGLARLGGPLSGHQGALVYRRDAELRFTTAAPWTGFPFTGWLLAPAVEEEEVEAVFVGHAGWGPGQLEEEVLAGVWTLSPDNMASWSARERSAPRRQPQQP
jgi:putative transcriptional regulator